MNHDNILEFIYKIPKAEQHLHIEGTLEPAMIFEIARRNNIVLKYRDAHELRAAYNFSNLQEFLDIYYLCSRVLKTYSDFYEIAMAYYTTAFHQSVVHSEIFFDPQTHLQNGVPFSVFFNAISDAARDAKKRFGHDVSFIMCFLRHLSEESALETLEMALPFKKKIIGIGLDSSELGNPPKKFERLFEKARQYGFHTVAHAGEEGPVEYIHQALDLLKVQRIDHGNRAIDDESLIQKLAQSQIPLTLCPLSNKKLKVINDFKEHPLKHFLDKNVLATVNSDDPAFFGGYLSENLMVVQQALNLDKNDIITLAKNSFRASFMSDKKKEDYIEMVDDFVTHFNKQNPPK
ncbi:MAG: adenosine deaminase [Bacteroidota bacterium]